MLHRVVLLLSKTTLRHIPAPCLGGTAPVGSSPLGLSSNESSRQWCVLVSELSLSFKWFILTKLLTSRMTWRNKHLLWCVCKAGLPTGTCVQPRPSRDICIKCFWAWAVGCPWPHTEQQGFTGLLLPASLSWLVCRIWPLSFCLFIPYWKLGIALVIMGTVGQAAPSTIYRTLFLRQLKLCLHLLAMLLNPFKASPTLDDASFSFLSGACIVLMDFFSSGMFRDQLLFLHRLHCHSDCRGSNVNWECFGFIFSFLLLSLSICRSVSLLWCFA